MAMFNDPWKGSRKPGFPLPPGHGFPALGPRTVSTTAAPAEMPGGGMTLDALMQRAKEKAAGQQVPMGTMQSPMQGAAYALEKGLAGFQAGRAEREASEAQGLFSGALGRLGPNGELSPEDMQTVAQYNPEVFLKLWQNKQELANQEKWENIPAPAGSKPGSIWQRSTKTGEVREEGGAGGGGVSVTVGGEGSVLDKKLGEKEGETWAALQEAGGIAAAAAGDFETLNELIKIAPQGPLVGRLAAMPIFKGVSSAGDAFQSVVKRLAPTLRVTGSGSTSDIEYQGMLDSLPALGNSAEANQAILEIMQRKANINKEVGSIIDRYRNGEMSQVDARKAITATRNLSLNIPPAVQKLIDDYKKGGGGGGGTSADEPAPELLP